MAEVTKVRQQFGWRNVFVLPCKLVPKKRGKAVSRVGGIALFWQDNVKVALYSFSDNHIDVLVGEANNSKRWRCTRVYGYSKVVDRHLTWSLIKYLS